MKDQTCDLCDPEAPTTAMFMVSVLGTGDVKLLCPADLVAMGDALREQLDAAQEAEHGETGAVAPGPLPDPATGDDTDDDQAADGEHAAPGSLDEDIAWHEANAQTQPDATPHPPDVAPADPVEVGSG